ncbi:hypothetical protein RP20_CCG002481 [Aedes albopictus]|nr:hypothetical protein RP20_CCG002481 [Aedes albopictus]
MFITPTRVHHPRFYWWWLAGGNGATLTASRLVNHIAAEDIRNAFHGAIRLKKRDGVEPSRELGAWSQKRTRRAQRKDNDPPASQPASQHVIIYAQSSRTDGRRLVGPETVLGTNSYQQTGRELFGNSNLDEVGPELEGAWDE